MKNNIPYYIIGGLLIWILLQNLFPKKSEYIQTKIVEIPAKVGNFQQPKPEVKEIFIVKKDTVKVYEQIYKDSLIEIKVIDTITKVGLAYQKIDYKIKPQIITIEQPIKRFTTLSAGLSIMYPNNSIMAEMGLKTKNGYTFTVGYGLDKSIQIGIKKDLIKF